jgi:hypothetical protein
MKESMQKNMRGASVFFMDIPQRQSGEMEPLINTPAASDPLTRKTAPGDSLGSMNDR